MAAVSGARVMFFTNLLIALSVVPISREVRCICSAVI